MWCWDAPQVRYAARQVAGIRRFLPPTCSTTLALYVSSVKELLFFPNRLVLAQRQQLKEKSDEIMIGSLSPIRASHRRGE